MIQASKKPKLALVALMRRLVELVNLMLAKPDFVLVASST
jgi:hypothetical protein